MALVINRTTLQVIKLANTPDYPTAQWIINPDLSAVDAVPKQYWKIVGDTVVEMDQTEKDAIDLAGLPGLKEQRKAEIDTRTKELISAGFEHPPASGKIFSLSDDAQRYIDKIGVASAFGSVTYPVRWLTKDAADAHDCTDANELENFFLAAVAGVRMHEDSGAALKETIQATTTVAACLAVEDTR